MLKMKNKFGYQSEIKSGSWLYVLWESPVNGMLYYRVLQSRPIYSHYTRQKCLSRESLIIILVDDLICLF